MTLLLPDGPETRFRAALAQSIASQVFEQTLRELAESESSLPLDVELIAQRAFERVAAAQRAVSNQSGAIEKLVAELMKRAKG